MSVHFSKQSDEWTTPRSLFDRLHAIHGFTVDAAATDQNALCPTYFTKERDALTVDWASHETGRYRPVVWLNPPYSRCRDFIRKAAEEREKGCTVVCLVPSRTDTRWFHAHVWDGTRPRPGVTVEFISGRLKFGDAVHAAPFPSMLLTFTPMLSYDEKQLQSVRP